MFIAYLGEKSSAISSLRPLLAAFAISNDPHDLLDPRDLSDTQLRIGEAAQSLGEWTQVPRLRQFPNRTFLKRT